MKCRVNYKLTTKECRQLIIQKMNSLREILDACLQSHTVQQAETFLAQYSQKQTFVEELLMLVPGQQHQLLLLTLSTLKNYITARWNPPKGSQALTMNPQQKQVTTQNIFNLYYEISHDQQAVNIYKQILYVLILAAYPWPGIHQQLQKDFQNGIFAASHFARQLSKAYEYSTYPEERQKAEDFVLAYFPILQNLVERSLENFNKQTGILLHIIFKTFYSSFHIELPNYLKQQQNFSRWFLYVKTVLNAPLENNVPNQRICAKILSRVVSQYFNTELDGKLMRGWNEGMLTLHGQEAVNTLFNCLANPNGDEQTASYILDSIMAFCKNQKLRTYLSQDKVTYIIYDRLLPNMELSEEETQLFQKDPIEYIRRDEDLNANGFRLSAADTIEFLLHYCIFDEKSELMKFIEYSAVALGDPEKSVRHKEVILRLLTKMSTRLKKNKFIRGQFDSLTQTYFVPLLRVNDPILNSEVCRLFGAYLDGMEVSERSVKDLMALIYQKMIGPSTVLRYNAILAFTSLLGHESALKVAKSHFQNILEIYVKTLDELEHQNLLKCLESIVDAFSNEIVTFAPKLIEHLINKFYQNCSSESNDDDEEEGNKQAIAALSTIQQILQCPLSPEIYYSVSEQILPMFKQIFDQLQEYFGQILSLLNVLVHKARDIVEMEMIYVICRKLLEGHKCSLSPQNLTQQGKNLFLKIQQDSDSEYEANLISILKNLIQKMPPQLLRNYPYPVHSQLLLALIENKKIQLGEISGLDTHMVDANWAQYLQSYKSIVYGQGPISDPSTLKLITGVSLYPWLKESFGLSVVKTLLNQLQEEEEADDDDYYEENTMQLLEKYAQQEEEDYDEYYGTEGVNYSFLYDSPFDSSLDQDMLKQRLKSLSNQEAQTLMNNLTPKQKKRLESLFQ